MKSKVNGLSSKKRPSKKEPALINPARLALPTKPARHEQVMSDCYRLPDLENKHPNVEHLKLVVSSNCIYKYNRCELRATSCAHDVIRYALLFFASSLLNSLR